MHLFIDLIHTYSLLTHAIFQNLSIYTSFCPLSPPRNLLPSISLHNTLFTTYFTFSIITTWPYHLSTISYIFLPWLFSTPHKFCTTSTFTQRLPYPPPNTELPNIPSFLYLTYISESSLPHLSLQIYHTHNISGFQYHKLRSAFIPHTFSYTTLSIRYNFSLVNTFITYLI